MLALLTVRGGGVTALSVMMALGFLPGLGFALGFALLAREISFSSAGLASDEEALGDSMSLEWPRPVFRSRGSTRSLDSGVDNRLGIFPVGPPDLRLAGSGDGSPLFSNMEINEVAGGREVVSVARLSTLDRADLDLLTIEPLLDDDTSAGCRRGEPFNVLVVPPVSPLAPEATTPVPGLALLLAANVAAMKLALFESVALPLTPPPPWPEGDDESGLLPSSEPRKRAWRSLSLSAASPRMLDEPVFCLLTATVLPVVCLLS